MEYKNGLPTKVTSIVISTQHSKDLNQEKVRELVIPYIKKSIPERYLENIDLRLSKLAFIVSSVINGLSVFLKEGSPIFVVPPPNKVSTL